MSTPSPTSLTQLGGARSPSPTELSDSRVSPSVSMVSSASSPVLGVAPVASGKELSRERLAMGSQLRDMSLQFREMDRRVKEVARLIETRIRESDLDEPSEEEDTLRGLAKRVEELISFGEGVTRYMTAANSSLHHRARSEGIVHPTSLMGKVRRFVSDEGIDDEELEDAQQSSVQTLQTLNSFFRKYLESYRGFAEQLQELKCSGSL